MAAEYDHRASYLKPYRRLCYANVTSRQARVPGPGASQPGVYPLTR